MLPKPRANLPSLAPQINLQHQQFIRIRMRLAFQNRRHAKLQLGEIIVRNRRVLSWRRIHIKFPLSNFPYAGVCSRIFS